MKHMQVAFIYFERKSRGKDLVHSICL